jgi:hypothetical protein
MVTSHSISIFPLQPTWDGHTLRLFVRYSVAETVGFREWTVGSYVLRAWSLWFFSELLEILTPQAHMLNLFPSDSSTSLIMIMGCVCVCVCVCIFSVLQGPATLVTVVTSTVVSRSRAWKNSMLANRAHFIPSWTDSWVRTRNFAEITKICFYWTKSRDGHLGC